MRDLENAEPGKCGTWNTNNEFSSTSTQLFVKFRKTVAFTLHYITILKVT